jgi:hypothetical protein
MRLLRTWQQRCDKAEQVSSACDQIVALLAGGPMRRFHITGCTRLDPAIVESAMRRLAKSGKVTCREGETRNRTLGKLWALADITD